MTQIMEASSIWKALLRAQNPKAEKRINPLADGYHAFLKSQDLEVESLIPLDVKGRRVWGALKDSEMIEHARSYVKNQGIQDRSKLKKMDPGLVRVLFGRNLMDEVGFAERYRDWTGMAKPDLVAFAKGFIAERGISGRGELEKANRGLYLALGRMKLREEVGLLSRWRDWTSMGKDALVAYAKRFIAEKGIIGRKELAKADRGLYLALQKRELLDESGLPDSNENHTDWSGMGKDALIAYAKGFIAEKGITGRMELAKANRKLYHALNNRKLVDEVGLSDLNESHRDWNGMDRDALIAYSKGFIAEKGITGRKGLEKADYGLYQVLLKRELLDESGLPDSWGNRRDWGRKGDDALVAHAKGFIAEKGITRRKELAKADPGLYDVLKKRKLMDKIGLSNLNERYRDWKGIGRDALMAYAMGFIAEKGITGRTEMAKADTGLYQILLKRELLDAVFSNTDSSKHKDAIDGVLYALDSFGDKK